MNYRTDYSSPLGKIIIASDGENITGLWFHGQKHFPKTADEMICNDELKIFKKTKKWLDYYFKGENPTIDFKLKTEGTEFQKNVWKILEKIPYGETLTYGEIARKFSDNMSAQAIGGAVGRNPISIIIPCHRVIGANGKITGYAGGIDKKIKLLKLEGYLTD